MPRAPSPPDHTEVPSRATSAWLTMVSTALHNRACDYVMWCAGHGLDAETLRTYLASTEVFPSHFKEWAASLSRSQVVASIPFLSKLVSNFQERWSMPEDAHSCGAVDLPPVVATVVTLATQQYIMTNKDSEDSQQGVGGMFGARSSVGTAASSLTSLLRSSLNTRRP